MAPSGAGWLSQGSQGPWSARPAPGHRWDTAVPETGPSPTLHASHPGVGAQPACRSHLVATTLPVPAQGAARSPVVDMGLDEGWVQAVPQPCPQNKMRSGEDGPTGATPSGH